MGTPAFAGRTAVVGVGRTEYVRSADASVLGLAAEACRKAVEDAGLELSDIDGMASFSYMNDSAPCQAVATALGVGELSFFEDLNLGGQAPCALTLHAAMAVQSGLARHVVVYRALKGRSGMRVGSAPMVEGASQHRRPVGLHAYPQYIAMWARRYLSETGTDADALGWVPVAQRRYAALNEAAIRRDPLSYEAYLESPMISDPFRAADCTIEVDGAAAIVVSSLTAARSLRHPPAVIRGGAIASGPRPGLDMGDSLLWDDMSANFTKVLAPRLWASAGLGPQDMTFAEIYDCFSSTVYFGLEGLGLVGHGEAAELVKSGETWLDGRLPVNTNGGLLAEGYLHGMNTVVEAVLQVQGRGGDRQVPHPDACVVTSGAMADGSALVLVAA